MNPLDRSQHKPATRTMADFEPCHIPARPSSEKPDFWSCRCWSCSAWIGHETAPLASEPWRYHVCPACWESLSVSQRIELAFRLSAAAEGGMGLPQTLNKVADKFVETSDEIVRTCRGIVVWLTEAGEMWRQTLARAEADAAAEQERLDLDSSGDDDFDGHRPPGGLGEGPADDSSDIGDADWWKQK